jgi:predicted molibdopterin-dependent oxidoreductase YjgC
MINLTINRQSIDVPDGLTVLQAAERLGITIPTLCYHRDLSPFGGCRLCVVEVQGARLPMTSCILPVSPGMVVQTESPALTRYRRTILRMLLKNYYDAGYKRKGIGGFDEDSEFANWARIYEIDIPTDMAKKPLLPVDSDPNPFVWVDMNKCIQCTRCVRACGEIQGRFVWSQSFRGYQARIVAGADTTMLQARCESCGACVAYCPTGALDNKMSITAGQADQVVSSTCAYCGVGCQLDLNVKNDVPGGRIIRVTSSEAPIPASFNGKHLCIKGRYGYEFIHSPRRLTRPRVRQYLLEQEGVVQPRPSQRGVWVDVDWDKALEIAAGGLRQVRDRHGGNAVAVLASGKLTNEENYLLNKLARQVLDSNQIDCCAHIYSASVVDGLQAAYKRPAMTTTFDQIANQARALLVIGSNLTEQHPVFGARIRQAILHRKVKMVTAYPDFTNIAEYSALPLYHRPNTETALINGLIHIILDNGWADPAISKDQGYAVFKENIARYTPQVVTEITGIPVEQLVQAAGILALNRPMAVVWGPGLAHPESGPGSVQSLVNLQHLLGNLEQPGGGLCPLRTQNNSQGASDMGALPGYLPGYQTIGDPDARRVFEQAWGTSLSDQVGGSARQIMESARLGQVKALYILGEEILNTSPSGATVRRGLEQCDFIVLQVIQSSETSRYADVLLPGVSFAEKSGTFTSAERRIQLVRKAIEPIGEARPDWQIIAGLAERILARNGAAAGASLYSGWRYTDTAQILSEIAALNPLYSGLTEERLLKSERLHWPLDTSGAVVDWFTVEQLELHQDLQAAG